MTTRKLLRDQILQYYLKIHDQRLLGSVNLWSKSVLEFWMGGGKVKIGEVEVFKGINSFVDGRVDKLKGWS